MLDLSCGVYVRQADSHNPFAGDTQFSTAKLNTTNNKGSYPGLTDRNSNSVLVHSRSILDKVSVVFQQLTAQFSASTHCSFMMCS